MSHRPEEKESLITTPLLQHRLAIGLGIAGGARGSLHKCATQLAEQLHRLEEGGAADAGGTNTSSSLLVDLQLQQIEMTKLLLQYQRNERLVIRLEQEEEEESAANKNASAASNTERSTTRSSNQQLRQELKKEQELHTCLREYEALATLTVSQHDVSEYALQKEWNDTDAQHQAALVELQAASNFCRVRYSQFHLLQQCLQDLKHSLTPDDGDDTSALNPVQPTATRSGLRNVSTTTKVSNKNNGDSTSSSSNNKTYNKMDIDDKEDGEESELYADLI